jgi:adenine-specific DNA-methyltransferase
MKSEYSEQTGLWLSEASKAKRKNLGQYMTPKALREQLIDQVTLFPGIRVLDPSCGTGEFLRSVLDREPSASVVGWDIDKDILEFAKRLVPEARLELRDSLAPYLDERFDLVIGNPPYFQFKPANEIRRHFSQVISGRPNIFALFFQVAFDCVTPTGEVAYVIPPSMNNGAYFSGLREFVVSHSSIKYLSIIEDAHKFEDAQTAVQLLVLKAGARSDKYIFKREDKKAAVRRIIFSTKASELEKLFQNRKSLYQLGYEAVTGEIVWNQRKNDLRSKLETGTVPLIWAHNLQNGSIELNESNPKKLQYIRESKSLIGPAIIVNRIVGSVGSSNLRAGLVTDGMNFVGENHVNVIRSRSNETLVSFKALLNLLLSPETAHRIRLVTGNTQISATELNHLTPFDYDNA